MNQEYIKLSQGHKIAPQVWGKLCAKFGYPAEKLPEYMSNGAEQTVYHFGDKYVLKLSNQAFIIKTAKKLRGKKIPLVARCFAVVKADHNPLTSTDNYHKSEYYCIVQERCKPAEVVVGNHYNTFIALSNMISDKATPKEILAASARLRALGIDHLTDLHGANWMCNNEGQVVLSDYGCIRF